MMLKMVLRGAAFITEVLQSPESKAILREARFP
jgi:hypothetical protein